MITSLSVRVIGGRDLKACDKSGTSDPYCVVSVGSISKKTKPVRKTLCPTWTEESPFVFDADLNSGEIQFDVFDWNMFSAHKRMGRAKLSLKDVNFTSPQPVNLWLPLAAIKSKDEVSGEIHIQLERAESSGNRMLTPPNSSNSSASNINSPTASGSHYSVNTFRRSYHLSNSGSNSASSTSSILEESSKEHPLFIAIKNSSVNDVQTLLADPSVDVNMKDSYGYTPLHAACCVFSERDDEVLEALLKHKSIDVNLENRDRSTPLHYFCAKFRSPSCESVFHIFIEKGAKVNASNNTGETPLHKAIFNNSVRVLMTRLLIGAGADVNKQTNTGDTPLHYAVLLGREDLVRNLLNAGSDFTLKGTKEKTPYELAVQEKNDKIIWILKRAKEVVDWLSGIDMERYSKVFIDHEFFLDILPELDESSLDRMGINTTGHRVKILKAVRSLKGNSSSAKSNVSDSSNTNSDTDSISSSGLGSVEGDLKLTMDSSTRASDSSVSSSEISDSIVLENSRNSTSISASVNKKSSSNEIKPVNLEAELEKLKYINKSGSWILHNNDLEFTVKLGSGTAGTVFKGLYRGNEVAIKVLKTEQSQKELEEFKKEFQIMSSIKSPYTVFFFGAVLEPRMCMVMELCGRGSLYHCMNDPNVEIGWDKLFSFSLEMVKGVDCLHSFTPQVLHRDFKSLNLMVNDQWHLKVGDFGLSRFNTDTQKETLGKMRGTFAYCAPEVYFGEKYSPKSDIFSISIVLWELVEFCIKHQYQRPYQEYPQLHFDFQIIIQTAKKGLRPTIVQGCPSMLKELIEECWNHDSEKRPTCKELLAKLEKIENDWKEHKDFWETYRLPPLSEKKTT